MIFIPACMVPFHYHPFQGREQYTQNRKIPQRAATEFTTPLSIPKPHDSSCVSGFLPGASEKHSPERSGGGAGAEAVDGGGGFAGGFGDGGEVQDYVGAED